MSAIGDQVLLNMGLPMLREAVTVMCQADFLVFQKVELGMEIGRHHRIWAAHLETGQDICEMAPRDHGKSASIIRAYALWKIKYHKWCRDVMIFGADQPSAVENLDKIKEMLESQPSLQYLVPTKRRDNFYSRTEIKLTNGKSIKVKGVGSPIRGRHPQLILMDDILNEQNSTLPEQQEGMKKFLNEVVVPMKDKGLQWQRQAGFSSQIVIVGTAQSREDLYHELLENPEWLGTKLRAVIDDEKKEVLWPERYSYEDLMKIKRKVGAIAFSKEYLNEPLSDDTTIFPPSLFEPLKDRKLSYVTSYEGPNATYLGADFSVPGSSDGDWTVFFVMMWDDVLKQYVVLNYWRARPNQMQEQVHQIELMCQRFKITLGYLEDNMFQGLYRNLFANRSGLPLSGHTVTHNNKTSLETGILSFRPMFENGAFRFPYATEADQAKTDLIITEFNGIQQRRGKIDNTSYHDDIVMGAWHALCAARTGTNFSVSWD